MRTVSILVLASLSFAAPALARDLDATPADLGAMLPTLLPGDTLHLASGTYDGRIRITSLNGTEAMPIVIEGPADGSAIVVADPGPCCNMIELRDSSFVVLRNLTLDGNDVDGAFGISAGNDGASGGRNLVHHITIESCRFQDFGGSINHDPISTKTTTWGWVIRGNVFERSAVVYLGGSAGDHPFIGGLIEHNLWSECVGYCMQIKWQMSRPTDWAGMPTEPTTTIVRDNVFVHGSRVDVDARPSFLVGGFPPTGLGSEDRYEIAGNLFVGNIREALLQASGRVSIHDNVFVDDTDAMPALVLRDHDWPLRQAWVYGNTFYVSHTAIRIAGAPDQGTSLVGNAIYAATPVSGTFDIDVDNVRGTIAEAAAALVAPSYAITTADFHPVGTALMGGALDLASFAADARDGLDFECRPRAMPAWRGAYEGPAGTATWDLALERKPDLCAGVVPGTDGGIASDAGVVGDGGPATADASGSGADAGSAADGGAVAPGSGGCGCRVGSAGPRGAIAWAVLALAILGRRRARRS